MKSILITILLTIAMPVLAGGEAVQQWWDDEYQQNIVPQQVEEFEKMVDKRCEEKLDRFGELTEQYPDDQYFQWKHKLWQEKCRY